MPGALAPYRSPSAPAALAPGPGHSYRAERIVAEVFLLGWCLLRLVLCVARGVDADGVLAGILTVPVALELVASLRDPQETTPAPAR